LKDINGEKRGTSLLALIGKVPQSPNLVRGVLAGRGGEVLALGLRGGKTKKRTLRSLYFGKKGVPHLLFGALGGEWAHGVKERRRSE